MDTTTLYVTHIGDQKIAAIKFIRALSEMIYGAPWGLKDAKDAVDKLVSTGRPLFMGDVPVGIDPVVKLAARQADVAVSFREPSVVNAVADLTNLLRTGEFSSVADLRGQINGILFTYEVDDEPDVHDPDELPE